MHNNLNILEIKTSLRTAALYSKCQPAKYLTVKQFKPSFKRYLSSTNLFPQPTPNCGSSCEKVTGSNVINVLKGARGGGLWPPGAKAFLLVTDNRRSWLDSPVCVITQHRKLEFSHHRQRKKMSNAQELTMQLSQTLSSAIAQIKVSNSPITQKRSCPSAAPSSFFQFLYNLNINFLLIIFMFV